MINIKFENLAYQNDAINATLNAIKSTPADQAKFFDIEMETGTGKTYVFLKTIFTLATQNFGQKFIIVVPTIAISAGVVASFNQAKQHLQSEFNLHQVSFYEKLDQANLQAFLNNNHLSILLLNINQINKQDLNLIHQHRDDFGGQSAMQLLASCNPNVIIDEPQLVASGQKSQAALKLLKPKIQLRYSATFKDHKDHHLIYQLDPIQAQVQNLVKKIVVHTYQGELDPDATKQHLIRKTIQIHLDRMLNFYKQNLKIKVLSLFFIDQVNLYRNANNQPGQYAKWFEQAFVEIAGQDQYRVLFANAQLEQLATQIHDGYFARDRKNNLVNTSGQCQQDQSVYERIVASKTFLLDPKQPLQFIFSHSALQAGWDNPNVFQICNLNEQVRSQIRARQQIGRGLRLALDTNGKRIHDQAVNQVAIVANQPWQTFVQQLSSDLNLKPVEIKTLLGDLTNYQAIYDVLIKHQVISEASFKIIDRELLWSVVNAQAWDFETKQIVLERFQSHTYHVRNQQKDLKFSSRLQFKDQYRDDQSLKAGWTKINQINLYYCQDTGQKQMIANEQRTTISEQTLAIDFNVQFKIATKMIDQNQFEVKQTNFDPYRHFDHLSSNCTNKLANKQIILSQPIKGQQSDWNRLINARDDVSAKVIIDLTNEPKSCFNLIALDSQQELNYLKYLLTQASLKFVIKIPKWWGIATPNGWYNPDWLVIEQNGQTKIIETKATLDQNQWRMSEKLKIDFAKQAFAQLGIVYQVDSIKNHQ